MRGEEIEGFVCPRCRRAPIVYNGNYFCDNLGNGCDWALSDDRSVWVRFGYRLYVQLMKQRGEQPEALADT